MSNIYVEQGYESREDYLHCLADEYDVDYDKVVAIFHIYGDNEAFDGLVNAVEDLAEESWDW